MGLFSKFIAKIKGTNDFSPADWAELEQELLASDLGPTLTKNFLAEAKRVKSDNAEQALIEILTSTLSKNSHEPVLVAGTTTIMVVGVNGTGKTTSVAKLASYYKKSGKSVVLAAGDTFRAAAVDQLKTWGSRIGVLVVSGKDNGDPASVAFDAVVVHPPIANPAVCVPAPAKPSLPVFKLPVVVQLVPLYFSVKLL